MMHLNIINNKEVDNGAYFPSRLEKDQVCRGKNQHFTICLPRKHKFAQQNKGEISAVVEFNAQKSK